MPVLRFETLPATDCILHRTVLRAPVGSNTEIDDESWPGFFHRAPGGEERLFRFQCKGWVVRARGRLVDKCMKDMAEKIFEGTSLKKIHARLACDTIPLK